MSTRDQLNLYLRGLESRLRLLTWSRGAAIACGDTAAAFISAAASSASRPARPGSATLASPA